MAYLHYLRIGGGIVTNLKGQIIKGIRLLTAKEMEDEGWEGGNVTAIELENGTIIYASKDEDGTGPGQLFGRNSNGAGLYITAQ